MLPILLVFPEPGNPETHGPEVPRDEWPTSKRLGDWFAHADLPTRLAAELPLVFVRDERAEKPPTRAELLAAGPRILDAAAEIPAKLILACGPASAEAAVGETLSYLKTQNLDGVTVLALPHPLSTNLGSFLGGHPEKKIGKAIKKAIGAAEIVASAHGSSLTWEDVVVWSEGWQRPEVVEGHTVDLEFSKQNAHRHLDVVVDGEVIGYVWSSRVNAFVAYVSGEPKAWRCSDSHSGEYYPNPRDAADAMAVRRLTGSPPPGYGDVQRHWAWEGRCLSAGERLPSIAAWMEVRGPYTPEHPWDEPLGDWPPCYPTASTGSVQAVDGISEPSSSNP